MDENGCSSTITTIISILTSTKNTIIEEAVTLYPNPSKDYCVLEIDETKLSVDKINLVDQIGNTVTNWNGRSSQRTLDLSRVPAGFYLLEFRDKNRDLIGVKKLVILQ